MKHNIESSLKRFLKRKVKITMGFVVAFLITGTVGFAEVINETISEDYTFENGDKVYIERNAETDDKTTATRALPIFIEEENKKITITTPKDGTISLEGKSLGSGRAYGVQANAKNSGITFKGESTINIIADGAGIGESRGVQAWFEGTKIVFDNKVTNINVYSDIKDTKEKSANATGAIANSKNAGIIFNGEKTSIYVVNGTRNEIGGSSPEGFPKSQARGVEAGGNGLIQLNSNITEITALAKSDFATGAYNNGCGKDRGIIFNSDYTKITAITENGDARAISTEGYGNTVLKKGDLEVSATATTGQAIALYNSYFCNIDMGTKDGLVGNISLSAKSDSGMAIGIRSAWNADVEFFSKQTLVSAETDSGIAQGVIIENHSETYPGAELKFHSDTKISAIANTKGTAIGINVNTNTATNEVNDNIGGSVIFDKTANIVAHSEEGEAIGIRIAGKNDKQNHVDFADNVYISSTTGKGMGTAISVEEKGYTKINETEDKVVQITGDINAETGGTITTNLSTKDSFITGVINDNATGENGTINIGMNNGATWNNTGNSSITELTLNNGIINNTSVENDISVGTLKGNGGDINMVAKIEEDGRATSGKLAIGKVANKDAKFNVNYSGEGNLEVSQEEAKKVFEDLAGNITVGEGSSFNANAKIEEGLISGEHTAEFVKGQGNEVVVKPNTITTGSNSMVEGMRDLATINVLSWRQEMSSLNERMGELRNSTGSNGVWARVYGGKVENGSKYDNEYQTYQVGYDKKYPVENGDLFVGALVSYTDGKTDYNLGDGENYSVGAGVYATWLNRDGQFADVVLKQSRLHNKFDVRSKNGSLSQHGDYSNWGTSLSGQYGRRFDLDDKFFVEPSVQLTFGRVSSEDYTTSAGVKVEQDTAYTLVGDVGTAVGYKFSDKGNVYARASLVKEFKGDIDTKYSYGGATEHTSEDLSDTWGEFGVGVNYRIKENVNMYVDIQRTEEATVENKWQANLGFRWEF